jgi:hypothetical protein
MIGKATILPAESDGLRHMLIITSNAYRDREGEIVSQKALEAYVEESWDGDEFVGDNAHLVWHEGDPIGDIVYADMEGPFLIEVARERPNATVNLAADGEEPLYTEIKAVWDALEHEKDLGASQGFYPVVTDRKEGVYQRIYKRETSVLPRFAAANTLTESAVVGARL